MSTLNAILIGLGIVVLIFVAIGAYGWYTEQQSQQHSKYCTNWYNSLQSQKQELDNNLFSDPAQYNKDVSDYNKECYY